MLVESETFTSSNKSNWKNKICLMLLILVLILGSFIYYQLQNTARLSVEAKSAIAQAQKSEAARSAVEKELDRCKNLTAQTAGNFKDFEYCQQFIDWAGTLAPRPL